MIKNDFVELLRNLSVGKNKKIDGTNLSVFRVDVNAFRIVEGNNFLTSGGLDFVANRLSAEVNKKHIDKIKKFVYSVNDNETFPLLWLVEFIEENSADVYRDFLSLEKIAKVGKVLDIFHKNTSFEIPTSKAPVFGEIVVTKASGGVADYDTFRDWVDNWDPNRVSRV